MKLFSKKEQNKSCCHGAYTPAAMDFAEQAKTEKGIKILGSGCAKCKALEAAVKTAVLELGWEGELQHMTDAAQIAGYGVMTTPALVLDGKVISYGKVLSVKEVKLLLENHRKTQG